MDKLTMAHEYAKIIMTAMLDGKLEYRKPYEIANEAFAVLDAMLVENDERKITAPDEIPKHERLTPFDESHVHDYIYGRICACGAIKECQPDTYPEYEHGRDYPSDAWVTFNGEARLAVSIKEDSLRKRPQ